MGPRKKSSWTDDQKKFNKTDMERLGIFKENGYISIGDEFKTETQSTAAMKGRQMLPGGNKERSSTTAGYFDKEFRRVMAGEAYTDRVGIRQRERKEAAKKNIGKAFIPTNAEKDMNGLGTYYGTFTKNIPAMDAAVKTGPKYKSPGRNVITNPGKLGTGFGYVDVTLSKYPAYEKDDYDAASQMTKKEIEFHKKSLRGGPFKLNMCPKEYFDVNPYKTDKPTPSKNEKEKAEGMKPAKPFKPTSPPKRPGGMMAGCFDRYPIHSDNMYNGPSRTVPLVNVKNKSGKAFIPTSGEKSVRISSVLNYNVDRAINATTYSRINSVMAY